MAADLQQLVLSIKDKHRVLAERYSVAIEQVEAYKKHIADLEYTVKQQQQEIERLSQQVEFMTVMNTSMPDRDDIEKSRAILSGLVREIDKCIADLTE